MPGDRSTTVRVADASFAHSPSRMTYPWIEFMPDPKSIVIVWNASRSDAVA